MDGLPGQASRDTDTPRGVSSSCRQGVTSRCRLTLALPYHVLSQGGAEGDAWTASIATSLAAPKMLLYRRSFMAPRLC
jgi:hypothetical protein